MVTMKRPRISSGASVVMKLCATGRMIISPITNIDMTVTKKK